MLGSSNVFWWVLLLLCGTNTGSKSDIAEAVTRILSELYPVPPRRKLWISGDYQMPMFEVIALALTFDRSSAMRRYKNYATIFFCQPPWVNAGMVEVFRRLLVFDPS